MDTFIHYGIGASVMAINDAGLEINEGNSDRVGVSIGSGIGGLPYIEKNYGNFLNSGPRKISPFFVPSSIINMVSGNLSIMYGITGPNLSLVSACATGTHSIGDAARMIKHGYVDCMIAGGAEMATCPLGIGGFASAKALCSTNNESPETASNSMCWVGHHFSRAYDAKLLRPKNRFVGWGTTFRDPTMLNVQGPKIDLLGGTPLFESLRC